MFGRSKLYLYYFGWDSYHTTLQSQIVLFARSHSDLNKQLKFFKIFALALVSVNTDKTKVMTINCKNTICPNFVYDNNNLEGVNWYKCLGVDLHHKLKWNYRVEEKLNGGSKAYFGLEIYC
jgi:hypothetical protein